MTTMQREPTVDLEAERELLIRRLEVEFGEDASGLAVRQVVCEAFDRLQAAGVRVPTYLPLFAERAARKRLQAGAESSEQAESSAAVPV